MSKSSRQGEIIGKISKSGITVKYNPTRLSLFEKDKYVGWVNRKEYTRIRVDSSYPVSVKRSPTYKDRYRVNFKPNIFEKPVSVKTGKMEQARKYDWKVFTYTKTQTKLVTQKFKQREIIINKESPFQKLTDLRKSFRSLGIRSSGFTKRET